MCRTGGTDLSVGELNLGNVVIQLDFSCMGISQLSGVNELFT